MIPEAREILSQILPELPPRQRQRVEQALALMRRRPPAKPRARPQGIYVDARMAERIRTYVRRNPGLPIREVGAHFGVDGGRVSEAIQHDR